MSKIEAITPEYQKLVHQLNVCMLRLSLEGVQLDEQALLYELKVASQHLDELQQVFEPNRILVRQIFFLPLHRNPGSLLRF